MQNLKALTSTNYHSNNTIQLVSLRAPSTKSQPNSYLERRIPLPFHNHGLSLWSHIYLHAALAKFFRRIGEFWNAGL